MFFLTSSSSSSSYKLASNILFFTMQTSISLPSGTADVTLRIIVSFVSQLTPGRAASTDQQGIIRREPSDPTTKENMKTEAAPIS
jgi:hypothetical protein